MMARLIARLKTFGESKFVRDTLTLQVGKMGLLVINVVTLVVVARGLGPAEYGAYQLVLTMFGLLMTFNLTGLGPSTITRLAEAIGAGDRRLARDLIGFYVQLSLVVAVVAWVVVMLFGATLAERWYSNPLIGQMLRVYIHVLFLLPLYHLALFTLQSTRAMRSYTLLENATSFIEAGLKIGGVLLFIGATRPDNQIGQGAAYLITAHVLAALFNAALGLVLYQREQRRRSDVLPRLAEVLAVVPRNSPRPYWQFGFSLALDKNLSSLFILLPVQFVGMWHGEAAAGFLRLGLSAFTYPALLFKGVLTNLETRLPAAVGQGDYAALQDNFRRVLRLIVPLAVGVFGVFALFAPVLVPILGDEYIPAIPVIRVLGIYGIVTGIGGNFGPLYRTLRLVRPMLLLKVIAVVLVTGPGLWLITTYQAVGGAWAINLVYAISVGLTVVLVLAHVRRLAHNQQVDQGL